MLKVLALAVLPLSIAACGGGGGNSSVDPGANVATTAGPGSTTTNATTAGTIQYSQYQPTTVAMVTKTLATTAVSATVAYDASSKQGSIQFPIMGVKELITTSDGYVTNKWTGPFLSGQYKLDGNILMGCNSTATADNQKTQVFASSSLVRVTGGNIDDLNGKTFDLIDCNIIEKGTAETISINSDGSLFFSPLNKTIDKNQVFDMLNPELWPGALLSGGTGASSIYNGFYAGHVYKYGTNGVTRYAIVIQSNSDNMTASSSYRYLLAVQR